MFTQTKKSKESKASCSISDKRSTDDELEWGGGPCQGPY